MSLVENRNNREVIKKPGMHEHNRVFNVWFIELSCY